jgi:GNAT superfamily N-acetyltransferase
LSDAPDAFRPTLAEEQRMTDDEWIELVERTVNHPRGLLLVAERGDGAVGVAFARITEDESTMEVGAMWVAPDARRQGVGRGLLNEALSWGRSSGAQQAELWVVADNGPAFRMYRASGFEPAGETGLLRESSDIPIVLMATTL